MLQKTPLSFYKRTSNVLLPGGTSKYLAKRYAPSYSTESKLHAWLRDADAYARVQEEAEKRLASKTSALLFSPRDERQIGGAARAGAREAEMVFIRVSLKSRFSKRLSPLSRLQARSLHQASRRLLYAFREGGLS